MLANYNLCCCHPERSRRACSAKHYSAKPAHQTQRMKKRFITSCLFSLTMATAVAQAATSFKFDFGSGKVEKGYTGVLPATYYTRELGYGFTKEAQLTAADRGGTECPDGRLLHQR